MADRPAAAARLTPGPLVLVVGGALARARLRHGLAGRGFVVESPHDLAALCQTAARRAFPFAVIDPAPDWGDGLELVRRLRRAVPGMRIVIQTAHDSFAAAILALRAGADDYLAEPVDLDALVDALLDRDRPWPSVPDTPLAAARVRWEHIQRIFAQCGHDVRETARLLCLQRRSVRMILAKRAPAPRTASG